MDDNQHDVLESIALQNGHSDERRVLQAKRHGDAALQTPADLLIGALGAALAIDLQLTGRIESLQYVCALILDYRAQNRVPIQKEAARLLEGSLLEESADAKANGQVVGAALGLDLLPDPHAALRLRQRIGQTGRWPLHRLDIDDVRRLSIPEPLGCILRARLEQMPAQRIQCSALEQNAARQIGKARAQLLRQTDDANRVQSIFFQRPLGLNSLRLQLQGVSDNPSQRVKQCRGGLRPRRRRRGRRNGWRLCLQHSQETQLVVRASHQHFER